MTRPTGFLFAFSLCLSLTAWPMHAEEEGVSAWTIGAKKKVLQARLEKVLGGKAVLVDKAGKKHQVPLTDLPEEERKAALIDAVGSGVVVVYSKDIYDEDAGVGSGIVVHSGGFLLTNYHVVRGAGKIEIEFRDNKERLPADCLAVDRLNDVAILKVAKLPEGVRVVELDIKSTPKQGDAVWTIGHPKGLTNTVSWGDVNAVRSTTQLPEHLKEFLSAPKDTKWIQTDAVLAQGSSGGPLLNPQGQAIGMNTFIAGPQLGFSLQLRHAADTYKQAAKASPMTLPVAPGENESAFAWLSREIGTAIKPYNEELEKYEQTAASLPPALVRDGFLQISRKYRPPLLEIARREPASWSGLQALYYLCSFSADDESDDGKKCFTEVIDLILRHHVKSKDLAYVMSEIGSTDVSRSFCQKILEESPHNEVKASAALYLAIGRLRWLMSEGGMDLKETTAARKEVEAVMVRLEKEFSDVETGSSTGKQWAEQLKKQLEGTLIGAPAHEIRGTDIQGKDFKLSDYKGKVVVLDFFAHWCPYCRKMYPLERKLVEEYKTRPAVILGVNTDSQQVLTPLVENGDVTWRTWADGQNGPIAAKWNVEGYPSIYLIDKDGIVRRHFSGTPEEPDFRAAMDALIKEVGG